MDPRVEKGENNLWCKHLTPTSRHKRTLRKRYDGGGKFRWEGPENSSDCGLFANHGSKGEGSAMPEEGGGEKYAKER